jgi:hypothetical protein
MATQQFEQAAVVGRRTVGGWMIGLALVTLVTLLVAGWSTMPAPARQRRSRPWEAQSRSRG